MPDDRYDLGGDPWRALIGADNLRIVRDLDSRAEVRRLERALAARPPLALSEVNPYTSPRKPWWKRRPHLRWY